MIDLHAHLLPGIDDGARDLDQAVNMARIAVADGIRTLVLTPHHLNGIYSNPAQYVRERCAELRAALADRGIPLELLPGSECHLVHELPAALREGSAMTVADRGRAVLVELPVHHVPHGAGDILDAIRALGLQPIIAHPERNSFLAQHIDLLGQWVDDGCLAQVTAQSCTGRFGPMVQETARAMLRRGLIHFMASDAHRDQRRIPELSAGRQAVEAWTSPRVGELLTETFPGAIVCGRMVDRDLLTGALPQRRRFGWWGGFGFRRGAAPQARRET